MTDKEMHKLSRRELLQLLLTQGRETEKLRQSLAAREEELQKLTENYERLKKRLDYKDEQISGLKKTLYDERTNRKIELDEAGSLAEAALRLNGVFDVAQKAAEQYLYNIRLLYDKKVAEYSAIEGLGQRPDEIAGGNTKAQLGIEERPEKSDEAGTAGSENDGEEPDAEKREADAAELAGVREEQAAEMSEAAPSEREGGGEELIFEKDQEDVPGTESDKEKTAPEENLVEEALEASPEEEITEFLKEALVEGQEGADEISAEKWKAAALEEVELEENTPEEQEKQGKTGRFKRWGRHAKHST